MKKYKFRLKDIINNYKHSIVIPNCDLNGNEVTNKEQIIRKIRKGEYKIIYVISFS